MLSKRISLGCSIVCYLTHTMALCIEFRFICYSQLSVSVHFTRRPCDLRFFESALCCHGVSHARAGERFAFAAACNAHSAHIHIIKSCVLCAMSACKWEL